jgi:threonine aldolase
MQFVLLHGWRENLQCGRAPRRPLKAITSGAGVDALSFGGTKNGLVAGGRRVFKLALADDFEFKRMQGMQLASR